MKAFIFIGYFTIAIFGMHFHTLGQSTSKNINSTNCEANYDGKSCWGIKKDLAQEKYALFSDAILAKRYNDALSPLSWLLTNTPNLNKSLYINAEKVYKQLEKTSKEDEKIKIQNQLLELYNQRIKYFGEQNLVEQKMGYIYYPYLINRKNADVNKVFTFYQELLQRLGTKAYKANVTYYLYALKKEVETYSTSVDSIVSHYELASTIIEQQIEKEPEWSKTKDLADRIFLSLVKDKIDCDFIQHHWGSQMDENPNDIKLIQRTAQLLVTTKCTDSQFFISTLKLLNKQAPSLKFYDILITHFASKEQTEELEETLLQKLAFAKNQQLPKEEAEVLIALGKMKSKAGNKQAAEGLYYQALKKDKDQAAKIYTALGDLYLYSKKECYPKTGGDPVKDNAVMFAAYEMYKKAGNQTKMQYVARLFPTIQDIFQFGYKEGDNIETACWIKGSFIIKKRP